MSDTTNAFLQPSIKDDHIYRNSNAIMITIYFYHSLLEFPINIGEIFMERNLYNLSR